MSLFMQPLHTGVIKHDPSSLSLRPLLDLVLSWVVSLACSDVTVTGQQSVSLQGSDMSWHANCALIALGRRKRLLQDGGSMAGSEGTLCSTVPPRGLEVTSTCV